MSYIDMFVIESIPRFIPVNLIKSINNELESKIEWYGILPSFITNKFLKLRIRKYKANTYKIYMFKFGKQIDTITIKY